VRAPRHCPPPARSQTLRKFTRLHGSAGLTVAGGRALAPLPVLRLVRGPNLDLDPDLGPELDRVPAPELDQALAPGQESDVGRGAHAQ